MRHAPVITAPAPPPKLWEGSFEFGLDGSEGNTQTFNLRVGADLKRKSKFHILAFDLDYYKSSNASIETANRAFLDWRYERLFDPSPWTWFVHGTVDYDEFQAFDLRVALDTGLGYHFIKTDTTSLLGRFGGGFSREIGGPNDRYVPEGVFGLDFEHQLNKRQKLTATVDYTPDVTNFGNYRVNSKAGWEVVLDEEANLSLKVSVLDRYDSTPNGLRPNDLDYAVTLLWSF
jgi:putative salt-induced outer membrane protein YdiY